MSESFCNGNMEFTIHGHLTERASEGGVRSRPEIEHRARGGSTPSGGRQTAARRCTARVVRTAGAPLAPHISASVAAAAAAYSAAVAEAAACSCPARAIQVRDRWDPLITDGMMDDG